MANTTNFNWETPDDTDLVKDGAAAIRTLGSSIDTTTKNLNPQTTTGAIAYRSATANVNTALPIGTANQVLRVNSGGTAPEWATTADQTPLTTKGDLFGFDTADARIPIGTNGHILTADSTQSLGLKWAAPAAPTFIGCEVRKTASQAATQTAYTTVTWNTETFDTDAFHDNSTNNSRITIPSGKGGYYLVYWNIGLSGNGAVAVSLDKNGSAYKRASGYTTGGGTGYYANTEIMSLAATDYIEVAVYTTSSGLNIESDAQNTKQSTFGVSFLGV